MGFIADEDAGGFRHIALFYRSPREYLDYLVPFVADAAAAGQPVLVALPAPNLALLRDTLTADMIMPVTLTDMSRVGRNPGHVLGGVLGPFAAQHPSGPIRMVGELIWNGRSRLEYPACVQQEALTNQAFRGRDITLVCPYDAAHLESDILLDAETTHPCLSRAGHPDECASPRFAPDTAWARYNEPLPSSPTAARYTLRGLTDLAGAREFAAKYARWFGFTAADIADLRLIVNELASHSLQHGRRPCTMLLWQAGDQLVCQVGDAGRQTDSPAGRRPIIRGRDGEYGLFVVNATADLVRIHIAATGTTVQAHVHSTK